MPGSPEFRHRLRQAIEGYNRKEICEAIGMSMRALVAWLSGDNQPLASTVADLCRVLDISADWLLGLSDTDRRAA